MKEQLLTSWKLVRGDVLLILIVIASAFLFIPFFTYVYFAQDLQSKEAVMNRNNTGLILLDDQDKPFFRFYQAQVKTIIPLDEIPEHVKNTIIISEDKDFYSHPGFSIRSILAAIVADIKMGELKYGGSTITQQLVKSSLLTPKKNFLRKYQELTLAAEIERRFTKDEILEMYLNSVYFGEGAFGVEQASLSYFGKHVNELDLAESALLAGLLPAPAVYSPYNGNIEKTKERQKYVLDEMVQEKKITKDEADKAFNQELVFENTQENGNNLAPHFALMVRDELIEKFGEERVSRSGFTVKTTLNSQWQQFAETAVTEGVNRLRGNNAGNGAVVVINSQNGEVGALVGSKNWNDARFGKVNMATSPRQPGSAMKPIIYLAAMEDHVITPATVLKDEPVTYQANRFSEPYSPKNYDNRFRGQVLVRRALANSLNIPSVEIMSKVGIPRGIEMGERMGITTLKDPSNYGLSFVLGGVEVSLLELTGAYSVFANEGTYNKPHIILEIKDKDGEQIYQHKSEAKRIVDKAYTFLISSILSDPNIRTEVFGNALSNSVNAAVKTGTTQNYRDALTVGFTRDLTIGVWVGNNDNQPMDSVAGSLGAAPIWKRLIENFQDGKPNKFEKPAGVSEVSICKENGLRLKEATSSGYLEYFVSGTEPTKFCNFTTPPSSPNPSASSTPSTEPTPTSMPTEVPQPQEPQGQSEIIQIEMRQERREEIIEEENNNDDKEDED
jgi:1A family penicillin-binding protein